MNDLLLHQSHDLISLNLNIHWPIVNVASFVYRLQLFLNRFFKEDDELEGLGKYPRVKSILGWSNRARIFQGIISGNEQSDAAFIGVIERVWCQK
jgi:hypothetical protein